MTHKSYSSGFGSFPNSTPKDKIQDIIEPARHLPFKIMITDPASKHAMETVKNPYSKQSCQLPRYAVAVYDVIKGAELLEDGKTMQKGLTWFQKYFTDQYYVLLA